MALPDCLVYGTAVNVEPLTFKIYCWNNVAAVENVG
jgi:hypothetical protein